MQFARAGPRHNRSSRGLWVASARCAQVLRAPEARAFMEGRLNLDHGPASVPTGAGAVAAGAKAAGAAAYRAGRVNLAKAKAAKNRFHTWLYERPDKQNFFLLVTNALYLALTLTILVLTLLVVQEHVDDFQRNEYSQHRDPVTGKVKQYAPCGMPTPDAMYLLQAIGALPTAGWDGASLEPDYKKWMQKVDRALCSRTIPGASFQPGFAQGMNAAVHGDDASQFCKNDDLEFDYGTEHIEELLAFGYLMDDAQITPTAADFDELPTSIDDKLSTFERRTCLVKKASPDYKDELPYYTEQQREAYGDLKTRVARAYIAAMPAFSRYDNERDGCAVPDKYKDPFDSYCKHSCHVRKELQAAASDHQLLYRVSPLPQGLTFTKMLYRLLALSLAGYYDRYHNRGVCFRNTGVYAQGDPHPDQFKVGDRLSAYDFCSNSMRHSAAGDATSSTNEQAVAKYTAQNEAVERAEQCGIDGYPPPPPAPPIYRHEPSGGGDDKKLSAQVCATILQYGLFEQGRLFGIPDVIAPFVVDNRVHPSLHFLGKLVYKYLYVKPAQKAHDMLADPKSKLELYIAYRLSSTSIWAILVANVAGYMMVRALAPMAVHVLKFAGFKTNIVKHRGDRGDIYEEIVLVRPQVGWPVYLAMAVTALAIYWILWVDPATQSHYYITPTCEDWQGLGVHVPSGAFGTTWGKRRYGRFGEHLIGVLLAITLVLMLAVIAVGKTFVPVGAREDAQKVKMGTTARMDSVALIMIAFALVVQVLFISQSVVSADNWYQAIKASDNDAVAHKVFAKDVWMSVWAAFWTSASVAWYRQKWAVDKLDFLLQLSWMASALLLLWMPVFQSAVLLEEQVDAAFSDGKGTTDTPRLIIYILIYSFSALWTVVLGLRLRAMWDAMPKRAAALAISAARVASAKTEQRLYIEGIEAAAAQAQRDAQAQEAFGPDGLTFAPASRLKFDLSAMHVGPSGTPLRPGCRMDAVYMPLMPTR